MNRLIIQFICVSLFAFSACYSYAQAHNYSTLKSTHMLLDLDKPGKPTVLIFWASWCSYCMAEIPDIKKLYSEHKNIQWLGVNVNKNPLDGLAVETEQSLPYESISDSDLVISDAFKVRGTPGFLIISANGQLIFKGRRINEKFIHALASITTSHSS